jgi:hypothetical protein
VLFKSFTGTLVENNMQPVLIASTKGSAAPQKGGGGPAPSIAQKKNQEMDEILGGGKK